MFALGCSTTPNDTDPMTTEGATSGETTGDPATSGDPTTSGGPTGQTTTGSEGGETTFSTGGDSGGEASPECELYCDEFMPNCSEIPNVEVYD